MKTLYKVLTIGLIGIGAVAMAGSVTIPNTFTANTTAKASEVNANFSAVKTAVNDNNSRINTNANNISTNAHDISTNAGDITTNANNIAANAEMWVRDHEGNIHPTVTIGSQVWMADNMYVTTYPDGTAIDDVSTWTDGSNDAYAFPIRMPSDYIGTASTPVAELGDIDIKRFGLFYQKDAATNHGTNQGICPSGWHIPTQDDFNTLQVALGGSTPPNWGNWNGTVEKIGDKIKLGGNTGFGGMYGGYLGTNGTSYTQRGSLGYFRTVSGGYMAIDRSRQGIFRRSDMSILDDYGFNIRCLKD